MITEPASVLEPLDVAAIRADFEILTREVNGAKLVYLDSAASSQKPRQMLEALDDYYRRHHANVHRGAHRLAVEATELYERARTKVANFIGAPDPRSLIFTRNATEAVNLVAASWGRANLRAGDEIVLSHAEHHANIVPWQFLAQELGVVLKPVGLTRSQELDLDAMADAITERTRLVTTFHVSNVLGAVNDLGAAIDYVEGIGHDTIQAQEAKLTAYATERLQRINSLRLIGNAPGKGAIFSFELAGAQETTWFIEDMTVGELHPEAYHWLRNEAQLVAVFDVYVQVRNYLLRVYRYGPGQ